MYLRFCTSRGKDLDSGVLIITQHRTMRRCSTDAAIIRAVKGKRVPCSEAEIIAQVTSYCASRFTLQAQEVVRRLEKLCTDGFIAKVPAMDIVGYDG